MMINGTEPERMPPGEKRPTKNERWVGGTEEEMMQSYQDRDEGDTGVVTDPAYNREGASRVLRSELGDQAMEHPVTPVPRAGASTDDGTVDKMSRDELRKYAATLSIPGRSKMTKIQLAMAVREAMPQ